MPITLLCPKLTCRAVLRVPDNARGKRVRCAECGMAFMVPGAGGGGANAGQRSPSDSAKK